MDCKKIFTINRLENKEGRSFFREVFIRRGTTSGVYGVEEPRECYMTYTTERSEKEALKLYKKELQCSHQEAIEAYCRDWNASGIDKSPSAFRPEGQRGGTGIELDEKIIAIMKKERILINLSLGFGLAEMGFESCLTREDVSIDHPELNRLTIRDFCMLSRERAALGLRSGLRKRCRPSNGCWRSIPSGWVCRKLNSTHTWTAITETTPEKRSSTTCATA